MDDALYLTLKTSPKKKLVLTYLLIVLIGIQLYPVISNKSSEEDLKHDQKENKMHNCEMRKKK